MSEGLLYRTFRVELEEGDGRTLSGICVPYDSPSLVADDGPPYQEQFARGAFARDALIRKAPNRVELRYEHGEGLLDTVGYGASFDPDRDDGLFGTFRALETTTGEQALAMVRAGILRFLSVGFAPKRTRREGGVLVRLGARLGEVSLVREAAYKGTAVALRSAPAIERPARDADLDRRLALLGFRSNAAGPPATSDPPA